MSEEIYGKQRIHNGPGKGDRDRTTDRDAYRDGWERIFGKKHEQHINRQSKKDQRVDG